MYCTLAYTLEMSIMAGKGRGGKVKRPPGAPDGRPVALRLWNQSGEFKAMCREHMQKINAERWMGQRCGAKLRGSGGRETCANYALANGRCRLHGGLTPKGEGWHRPTPPSSSRPGALERKIRNIETRRRKAAKALEEKLAAMTPAERESYLARMSRRVVDPGPAANRRRKREAKKNAEWLRALLSRPDAPAKAAEPARRKKRNNDGLNSGLAAPGGLSGVLAIVAPGGDPSPGEILEGCRMSMKSKPETPAIVALDALRKKIRREGAEEAFAALRAVCNDAKAPAPARATAAAAIFRAAGLFEKSDTAEEGKLMSEMTPTELNHALQRVDEELKRLSKIADAGEPAEGVNPFD